MLMTFITTLKVLVRDRSVLMWAVAFPLVLSTLFVAMFSNLDEMYQLDPIAVVVVQDETYDATEAFSETIEALAQEGTEGEAPLFAPVFVKSEADAQATLEEGDYKGYIKVDSEGNPIYTMDTRRIDSVGNPSQTILKSVLDRYVQDIDLITTIIEEKPSLLKDPDFIKELIEGSDASLTEHISITANEPSDSLRYYYAVLAFSTIMMATFALTAIDMVLANTSPLGARRSLGGQSKVRTLVPTLGAAWLLSFACVLLGFLYLRFVFDVGFGGKEPAVILTLALSTLAATFLGALLGSLPIPTGAKSGYVAVISCVLSLFAGLFGPFSQTFGDMVARELPWLSACNPVRQAADAFFSLYYYDGYAQLAQCLLSLLIFSFVFFIISTLIIRRQRYASL